MQIDTAVPLVFPAITGFTVTFTSGELFVQPPEVTVLLKEVQPDAVVKVAVV